ncbi:flocculation-associated PEP-CTERM protein PepA [Methylomonas sp. 2BW1-5-20]|uniref:flocculation-associated PEP-CTERM protein PepA n=1 Tax=Methylomonas sp. 2BW1-5-20 TaxID=3376686 RepID=UPI00404E1224
MKTHIFKSSLKRSALVTAGLIMSTPVAFAATTWVGTADYTAAPTASGLDEDVVGPFDTYDFGLGVSLIKFTQSSATTGSITGWYQSAVVGHSLDFVTALSPNLNSTGIGSGYELTAISRFTGTYNISGSTNTFQITGGSVGLYFDTTPDYNFASDSGFEEAWAPILFGNIAGGEGSVKVSGANTGSGFEELSLNFSGAFGGYDHNVYSPDTIGGGDAIFTIKTKGVSLLSGVNSVLGESKVGGELFAADGNLQLTAVPVPAAAWLFGTGLVGFFGASLRKKIAA